MSARVRFAPSPTGRLHLGNARGALINWLFAQRDGGEFILRLDDTDRERSSEAFALAIAEDLGWLGLDWHHSFRQSERLDLYARAVEKLRVAGRLYPCYETEQELEQRRFGQFASGAVQVYDRAALRLSNAQRQALEAEGRKPYWRFHLEPVEVAWTDLIRGRVRFHGAKLSDPVLVRADGSPTYTLASVVDDVDMAVSHVIRGEDHVTNTAVQLQLFAALGREPASLAFAHFTLMTDAGGHNLSKRLGSLNIAALREDGIEPMAINSLLARLGTSESIEPKLALSELSARFDLRKFSRASPKLDLDALQRLNADILHMTPFAAVRERLAVHPGLDEAFWLAVRPNIVRLSEAGEWWRICRDNPPPADTDRDFAATAATLLPPEPWDEATWNAWTSAVAGATGRRGRELFRPLRLSLTGREHGPELKTLLPMIGRDRVLARLAGRNA